MSLKSKFKGWNPFQQPLLEVSPATDIPPKERAQVEQLIANGKCGVAVDIAKQVHKRFGNASSEALLVDAYVARISELAERKLDVEASTLLDQVGERYPISKDRLRVVAATLKARGGDMQALLELLADASVPAETRAVIETRIRGDAGDPAWIARCEEDAAARHQRVLRPPGCALREIPGGHRTHRGGRPPGSGGAGDDGTEAETDSGGRGAGEAGGRGVRSLARNAGYFGPGAGQEKSDAGASGNGQSGHPVQTGLPRPGGAAQATHLRPGDDGRGEGGPGVGGHGRPLFEERVLLETAGARL